MWNIKYLYTTNNKSSNSSLSNRKYGIYIRKKYIEIRYLYNDKLHRINEPAYICYNKYCKISIEYYYINNKYHRLDGPAVIDYFRLGIPWFVKYYINGVSKLKNEYDFLYIRS